MIVKHKVEDVARWRPVHERSAEAKRKFGWTECAVFSVAGDPNHVLVMEHFDSIERARAYAESKELLYELAASGVSSQPEIQFVTSLQAIARQ
jgi:hypothetical protein